MTSFLRYVGYSSCDPKPYKIVGYDPLIRWYLEALLT